MGPRYTVFCLACLNVGSRSEGRRTEAAASPALVIHIQWSVLDCCLNYILMAGSSDVFNLVKCNIAVPALREVDYSDPSCETPTSPHLVGIPLCDPRPPTEDFPRALPSQAVIAFFLALPRKQGPCRSSPQVRVLADEFVLGRPQTKASIDPHPLSSISTTLSAITFKLKLQIWGVCKNHGSALYSYCIYST